ncbi:MAG: ATP-binding cassette domain-containing protein, partial [Verrucomicrobiota bacterium]|nr:ATP-binding cassette domain-containing protein [Verrucomicrobiota bacterium]
MLQVEEIEFQYPQSDYRLRIDHFACQAAQATAIVGPSGCGKTTFLNLAAGILHPSRGVVSVDGVEVSSLGDAMGATFRLTRIGLIFQEFELV